MTEVKFHTKPTQINREDPILVMDDDFRKLWLYPLNSGYFAGFMVHANGMSEVAIVVVAYPGGIHWLDKTSVDTHTRQDLVKFVKDHDSYTEEELLFALYEDVALEYAEITHPIMK